MRTRPERVEITRSFRGSIRRFKDIGGAILEFYNSFKTSLQRLHVFRGMLFCCEATEMFYEQRNFTGHLCF